jgi:hypothetical protein
VRFLDPAHTVAQLAWGAEITMAGKLERRTAMRTATLRKVGSAWMIETVHNTLTGGPGYSFK